MIIINEATLDLFRGPGPCEFCNRPCQRREPHHALIKRGLGGGHRLDVIENLMALGGPWDCACHVRAENGGHPDHQDCLKIISARERKEPSVIMEYLWRLLRKDKHESHHRS